MTDWGRDRCADLMTDWGRDRCVDLMTVGETDVWT